MFFLCLSSYYFFIYISILYCQKNIKHKIKERAFYSPGELGTKNSKKKDITMGGRAPHIFLDGIFVFSIKFWYNINCIGSMCVVSINFYSTFEGIMSKTLSLSNFVRNAWLNVNEIIIIPKWQIKIRNVYLSDWCCEFIAFFVVKEGNCVLESNREHCSS